VLPFGPINQCTFFVTNLPLAAMGKNKWYFESETNEQQQTQRAGNSSAQKHRRASYAPGRFVHRESPESLPFGALLRLVLLRARRSWVAFRYQANRYSLGVFRHRAALKMGFAGLAAYLLLFSEQGANAIAMVGGSEGRAVETSLDLGGEETNPVAAKNKKIRTKNEAAPVSADELLREQTLDYIERYHTVAVGEMEKFGIPASISLAQGLIESRAGTSKLAVNNNNHFGIKCFSRRCKKGHCSNFTDDTHKDFFRKFPSPWESWRAHSQLLASGRYAKLKRHGRDYRQWAYGLKAVGYATDRSYAEKLIGIIERYDLHQYDR
jgi:flagellum-specific peptidoglycan hydrolase FlgJ